MLAHKRLEIVLVSAINCHLQTPRVGSFKAYLRLSGDHLSSSKNQDGELRGKEWRSSETEIILYQNRMEGCIMVSFERYLTVPLWVSWRSKKWLVSE
jgi:hypothetical protein